MSREKHEQSADQIALLIFLTSHKQFNSEIGRFRLEKSIYFANVFSKFFDETFSSHPFIVRDFGPFSKEIYSDMEDLFIWDLAKSRKKGNACLYNVTDKGIETVKNILDEKIFRFKQQISFITSLYLNLLPNPELKDIVYNELNFKKASEIGYRTPIDPEYPFVRKFIELAKKTIKESFEVELSPGELLFLYLEFLKKSSRKTSKFDLVYQK
jgi:uncharacterized protein YwgA